MQSSRFARWLVGSLLVGAALLVLVVVGYPIYRHITISAFCPPDQPPPPTAPVLSVERSEPVPLPTEFDQLRMRARAVGCDVASMILRPQIRGFTCYVRRGPCNCVLSIGASHMPGHSGLVDHVNVSAYNCSPGAMRREMLTILEPLVPSSEHAWFREFTARPVRSLTLEARSTQAVVQSETRAGILVTVDLLPLQPSSALRDDTSMSVDLYVGEAPREPEQSTFAFKPSALEPCALPLGPHDLPSAK